MLFILNHTTQSVKVKVKYYGKKSEILSVSTHLSSSPHPISTSTSPARAMMMESSNEASSFSTIADTTVATR